jgi:hypothetical protein
MPEISSSKSLKKAGKRIYERAYRKAKAEALRKARKKRVEEIRKKAREAAEKKFSLTKSEKRASRIKKAKAYAKGLSKNLEGLSSGFMDEPVKKTVKRRKTGGKRRAGKKTLSAKYVVVGGKAYPVGGVSVKKKKRRKRSKVKPESPGVKSIWDRGLDNMF